MLKGSWSDERSQRSPKMNSSVLSRAAWYVPGCIQGERAATRGLMEPFDQFEVDDSAFRHGAKFN